MMGLVSTSVWIFGPDGEQVRAVYGDVTVMKSDDVIGMPTGRQHAPWSVIVSGEHGRIIIPGCKVDAFIELPEPPQQVLVGDERAPSIWFASGEPRHLEREGA